MPKDRVCPDFCVCRLVDFPTAVTCKSPTIWNRITDHQKAERAGYRNGIRDFWSFGQPKAQKLSFVQLLFCPEQNSAVKLIFEIP
jgi:hypothetical protein